jgi:hypothetical protein
VLQTFRVLQKVIQLPHSSTTILQISTTLERSLVTSTVWPSLESSRARLLGGMDASFAQCRLVQTLATSEETPRSAGRVAVGANNAQAARQAAAAATKRLKRAHLSCDDEDDAECKAANEE